MIYNIYAVGDSLRNIRKNMVIHKMIWQRVLALVIHTILRLSREGII